MSSEMGFFLQWRALVDLIQYQELWECQQSLFEFSFSAPARRRQKWSVDPRNSAWSNDDSKFGQKMLEKMGWSKGKVGSEELCSLKGVKLPGDSDLIYSLTCTENLSSDRFLHFVTKSKFVPLLLSSSSPFFDNLNSRVRAGAGTLNQVQGFKLPLKPQFSPCVWCSLKQLQDLL